MNPQQFDLEVFDHLPTNNPDDPVVGLDIIGSVSVTINWNDDRTDLAKKGVEFADVEWLGPGGGPFTVFEDVLGGGLVAVAKVDWTVATSVLQHRETDTPNQRFRTVISPLVKLLRRRMPVNGGAPTTDLAYTASTAVKGDWQKIA